MSGATIRNTAAALFAGAAGLSLDQWSKIRFFDRVQGEGSAFSFFDGLVRSTLHHNYGISFNLPIPLWLTLIITGAALGWAFVTLYSRIKKEEFLSCLILGLFIGGVLGNVSDRIVLGYVRDWILLFGRSAINIADLLIAGSLLAWMFLPRSKKHELNP